MFSQIGNEIQYWTYIVSNSLGYPQDVAKCVIESNGNGNAFACAPSDKTQEPDVVTYNAPLYKSPKVIIQMLCPNGFEAFIKGTSNMLPFLFEIIS